MAVGCQQRRPPALPSLEETYRFDDKKPFGGYVAFQETRKVFDNLKIVYGNVLAVDADELANQKAGEHSLYMIIAERFFPEKFEANWLMDYVNDGNDLFLSANFFDADFLKRIDASTNQSMAYINEYFGKMEETDVRIYFGEDLPDVPFGFYYFPFNHHFKSFDSTRSRVLGTDTQNLPDLLVLFIGKGRLYLHLAPRSLGNYFLLTKDNIDYFHHVINYFRPNPATVYWDEYYNRENFNNKKNKKDKDDKFDTLSVIMTHSSLKWAFILAVSALIFFIFSNLKRRQRIIPVQVKPQNATVDFVETVGRLYFVNKNNKNIATKLITYFYEHVRNKYYLKPDDYDKFSIRLAGKKGMSLDEVTGLLECIHKVEISEEVSDEELLELNKKLEKFYTNK